MLRFHLKRIEDESGVSGTGRVAEGVMFQNGKVALTWLTRHTSVVVYDSIQAVREVHGHGGKTLIIWDEEVCSYCKHPFKSHWGDNCGACMAYLYDDTARSCDCVIMGHEDRVPVRG